MITLSNTASAGATVLSNLFIDQYMPAANGEFVKVYIYLLRNLSGDPVSLSLEAMADRLQNTEKDILRALTYWENQKLLILQYHADRTLTGIRLLDPTSADSMSADGSVSSSPVHMPENAAPERETPNSISQSRLPSAFSDPDAGQYTLTLDKVKELKQNEDVSQLLFVAETYLGKTLTPTETRKLLYFYDGLKMSADLIEYLIEYCVENNHRSIRYIEKVALAWAENGVQTIEQAKNASSQYQKEYYDVLKALGITNRSPVAKEVAFINVWLKQYGFTMDIIQEACSRTVLQTGQASFSYADRILTDWQKHDVHTLKDIQALDSSYQKKRTARAAQKPAAAAASHPAASANRFNNFEQRQYNFDEYEKRLLSE